MTAALRCALLAAAAAAWSPASPFRRRPTRLDAVWSNELAIRDYQNLLQGKAEARLDDGPGVVLAPAGDAFAEAYAAMAPGSPDAVLAYGDALPEALDAGAYPNLDEARLRDYPIYVCCMTPEACAGLDAVLADVPEDKKEDLVFLQRGDMIEPILKKHFVARERQTQAVLYLGINEYGKLEDDRTNIGEDVQGVDKWAAESCATGKWAGAVADRLRRADFHCSELFHRDWRRHAIEAVIFESVYNVVGAVHQHVPISEVHKYFGTEVDDMLYEIQKGLRGHLALTLLSGVEERMAGYAATQFRSKKDNRAAAASKSSPFRNVYLHGIAQDALAKGFPDPWPMHTEYWEYALEKGVLED